MEARFDRGVLEVRIPKPEQIKPRKVTISVGSGSTAQDEIVEGTANSTEHNPAEAMPAGVS